MKYALDSNLILSTQDMVVLDQKLAYLKFKTATFLLMFYRAKKVTVLCEFPQKLLLLLKKTELRDHLVECDLENFFCNFSGVNGVWNWHWMVSNKHSSYEILLVIKFTASKKVWEGSGQVRQFLQKTLFWKILLFFFWKNCEVKNI